MGKIKKYSEFGNCKICNDSATGIHYNVASCEGCKGFFKRSVLLSKKYECYYGYTCIISVENRIRCKGCRFKSCIENGMSTEFLCGGERKRKRRIGVKKYDDRLKKIALAHIANEEKSKNKILEKIYEEPITNVIDAKHVVHGESNDQTEFFNLEECLDFLQEPIFPDASDFSILAESSNLLEENFQPNFSEAVNLEEESLESIKSGLVNGIDYLFESLINFLKEIPGFYIQNFSDYSFLINNRLFDYFLVGKLRFFKQPFKLVSFKIKYSHLVQNDQSFILLPNNIQFSKFWMQRTFGNEMVEAIFDFARKFNSLGLSPHEISLLIPAALTIYGWTKFYG